MLKEKSCGAIVYAFIDEKLKFLLIKHVNGKHWSFPKGHVESGETEIETALREVKEETGLYVDLDSRFREIASYNIGSNIKKDVVYFIAKANLDNNEVVLQKEEISKYGWFDFESAIEVLTFGNDKRILKGAKEYLKNV